ncbi:hypothetical protein SDC9_59565 [bioreactor metagenome]|uniref:Uncharacterized protein n=1 Tax=bioreactor metagenome TaxID=1076179 RepID=A0A644XAS6_9ZZZZ
MSCLVEPIKKAAWSGFLDKSGHHKNIRQSLMTAG